MKPERLKKALVLEVTTDLPRLPGRIHSLPVSQSRARCGKRCLWILSGRRLIHVPLTLVMGEHDLPQEKMTFQPSVGLSNYVGGTVARLLGSLLGSFGVHLEGGKLRGPLLPGLRMASVRPTSRCLLPPHAPRFVWSFGPTAGQPLQRPVPGQVSVLLEVSENRRSSRDLASWRHAGLVWEGMDAHA